MDINGKIIGFDLLPKDKGAKIFYTDNVIEEGEYTCKELNVKVNRAASHNLKTILRTLVGHGIYVLGLSNDKLGEKEFKSRKIVDLPAFKNFEFCGFKISGDGEDEQLIVKMKLKNINDEWIPITSGKIGIADGTYVFDELLAEDLEQAITEVKSYLDGKNYFKQPELPFPEQEKAPKNKKKVTSDDEEL